MSHWYENRELEKLIAIHFEVKKKQCRIQRLIETAHRSALSCLASLLFPDRSSAAVHCAEQLKDEICFLQVSNVPFSLSVCYCKPCTAAERITVLPFFSCRFFPRIFCRAVLCQKKRQRQWRI